MSNKTQLQTNNTNLDTLIARVNTAKNTVASLPEAGGGGSSGNVETCTITIVEDGPAATFIGQLFYTASDGSIMSKSNINAGESLVVIKNTMVTTSASLLGSAVLIGNFYGNVYQITGNCTIKANM